MNSETSACLAVKISIFSIKGFTKVFSYGVAVPCELEISIFLSLYVYYICTGITCRISVWDGECS